jgi:hypothetical protein
MIKLVRLLVVCLLAPATAAYGEDVFVHVPLTQLEFKGGSPPAPDGKEQVRWRAPVLIPFVALDGPGEAYIADAALDRNGWGRPEYHRDSAVFVAKLPSDQPIGGTVFVPDAKGERMVALKFSLKPQAREAGKDFYHAKAAYYEQLQDGGAPGAAFFRYEAGRAHKLAGDDTTQSARHWRSTPDTTLDDTYDLFTGGRAVSENLQLTRALPARPGEKAGEPDEVACDTIEGIEVRAFDWSARLGDSTPALDPLASAVPADQHAVFFPSFQALLTAMDTISKEGLPIYRGTTGSTEDGMVLERYERQLCLPRTALARLLGQEMVKSVAITGGDPYFPTGTDVAVIFETPKAEALRTILVAQVKLSVGAGAAPKSGEAGGVKYEGAATEDRAICSYIAVVGASVVATNSLEQLKRLVAVQGGSPSLASLKEYQFFRTRYPLGNAGETAFVMISDPTIRRWCGPRWRIGASRRLRSLAVMSDVTAAHMGELVAGLAAPASVESEVPMRTIGELSLTPKGVRSSVYNTLGFVTPIGELDIRAVTTDEAAAYRGWRGNYERNWSWAFDPIALSLGVGKERVAADLSVVPLIFGTGYRTWATLAQGVSIAPGAGDPHDAILHAVCAINTQSIAAQQAAGFAGMMAAGVQMDPLGWLGESVAIYADADPVWERLLKEKDPEKFFEKEGVSLPIAINAEVSSALKLTAFLAAVRGMIEQSAPGMAVWETRTYKEQPYVCVGLSEKARANGGGFDKLQVFYAATPKALIITLSEDLLKRALDRQAERAKGAADQGAAGKAPEWLGKSLAARFKREGLDLFHAMSGEDAQEQVQHDAWSNLPILNEWKRRFPEQDPMMVQQRLWGTRLVSPGGGGYEWDGNLRTMTSTLYGNPADPKAPPGADPLSSIRSGDLGVTLAEQGLRARAVIERKAD